MNPEIEATLRDLKITFVESLDELDSFRRWLGERRPILGVDTETSGLSRTKDKIRLYQFGDARGGYALPYEDWRGAVKEVLAKYEGPLVLHNAKFDAGMTEQDGIKWPWERTHDTLVMCALNDSLGPKGLKPAAALHIGPTAKAGQSALSHAMMKHGWTWGTVPVNFPPYYIYGVLDTCLTAILAEQLWPRIQYAREAYDLEMAVSRVLCDTEGRGARVDVPYITSERDVLYQELEGFAEQLGGVNPNSGGQIIAALMAQGAKFTKVTEKGQLSTDDDVMKELEDEGFEIAGLIRKSRANYKIAGSYFTNWLKEADSDGFLHPSINQLAAKTSRMSITKPALQTLHKSKRVRRAFIPRDGNRLVFIDYANEEVRVAGHYSGDEAIIKAFAEGRDLHSETAKRIFGEVDGCLHEASLKCKHRAVGKTGFLGKLYGSGVDTFADTVGMPKHEATKIHQAIAEAYPGLERFMAQVTRSVQARAREAGTSQGYVTLIDGRHIQVPANQGYKGTNALIQGSCATVIKRAMVDLDLAGLAGYLLFPIHDELGFDVPTNQLDEVVPELVRIMERKDFRIPLTVEPEVVSDWGEKYD
jgi:DNA polymerase-1